MDKLIIMKTVARAIDQPTDTDEQFKAYEARLIAAISDYLGWLEQWKIPKEYLHGRFGQTVYHNPEIIKDLQMFSPETKLLRLIDDCEGWPYDGVKCTASEIEKTLKPLVGHEAYDLLRRPGSCGKYLMRLCKQQPTRVKDAGRYHGGSRRYIILAPK